MSGMMKRLVVSLGDAHESTLWCWGNAADKRCLEQGECQPGEQLPEKVAKTPAIVLIPGQRVIIRQVSFKGSPRLARAHRLAWQFEDELLQEADALNWVVLSRKGSEYLLAGYCRKERERWLSSLATLGIKPLALIPDVLATPFNGQPVVYKLRQYMLHRRENESGYCVPSDWPLDLLVTGNEPAPLLSDLPEEELLWQCAGDKATLRLNLLRKTLKETVLGQISKINVSHAAWAGAAMLMMSLVVGAIGYQRQITFFERQALATYSKLFPEESSASPLNSLKQRIVKLEEKLQQPQFFAFGEQLNQAMTEAQRREIQSLHFDADAGTLVLTLRNFTGESFSNVNENGYQIKLEKDGVGATITVREEAQ